MFKIRVEDMGHFDVSDTSDRLELCFGQDTLPKVEASDASMRESRCMAAPYPAPVLVTVRTSPSISAAGTQVSAANTVTHA